MMFLKNCSSCRVILFILMAVLLPLLTVSGKEPSLEKISLGIEFGNWQPHSLNDEPQFTTFGAAGATPYYGVSCGVPLGRGFGLRVSLGYWSLRDLEEVETVHSLTLHPLTLDIKYRLIPDYWVSAYVIYGGGVYWGVENETSPFGKRLRKAQAGWGGNLGAGFDLALTSHFVLGMTFQYHYVRFKDALGGVDDFSGPKITGGMSILF